MKKIKLFCEDCYAKRDMKITKIGVTKKGNIRIDCWCLGCSQKYSLTRRKGILNKIEEAGLTGKED